MPKKDATRYVLCISDQREYEQLRAIVGKESPDAECIQSIPTGYLTADAELVCGYFVGNGNIRDQHGKQTERHPVLTEPVKASDHWTPGTKGRFGTLRLPEFLGAVAQSIRDTTDKTGIPANANVRHYDGELSLGYG